MPVPPVTKIGASLIPVLRSKCDRRPGGIDYALRPGVIDALAEDRPGEQGTEQHRIHGLDVGVGADPTNLDPGTQDAVDDVMLRPEHRVAEGRKQRRIPRSFRKDGAEDGQAAG